MCVIFVTTPFEQMIYDQLKKLIMVKQTWKTTSCSDYIYWPIQSIWLLIANVEAYMSTKQAYP